VPWVNVVGFQGMAWWWTTTAMGKRGTVRQRQRKRWRRMCRPLLSSYHRPMQSRQQGLHLYMWEALAILRPRQRGLSTQRNPTTWKMGGMHWHMHTVLRVGMGRR
jgi:hypothetical protein